MESKFRLSVSPFLFALLSVAGAVAAAGILAIITIPPPFRIAAAAVVVAMFAFAVRRHALLRGKDAVQSATFLSGGEVELSTIGGVFRGKVRETSVSPILASFVAECGGRKFRVLAAFDSIPQDAHRQLRIRLRAASLPPPPAALAPRNAKNAGKSAKPPAPPPNVSRPPPKNDAEKKPAIPPSPSDIR